MSGKHISETLRPDPPPGVTFYGNATKYEPESLRAPEWTPEDPELTPNEVDRAAVLGLTIEQAEDEKIKAYRAEMERFGVEDFEVWLERRASFQGNALLPSGPPAWPLPAEPTVESEARRLGMTPDSYVGMQTVENVYDFERLQGELAHKAEIEAEARRQLELEQAKRRIAAEGTGDEAA